MTGHIVFTIVLAIGCYLLYLALTDDGDKWG